MTDPTPSPPQPSASAEPGSARPVLLVDLAPPSAALLAPALTRRGADVRLVDGTRPDDLPDLLAGWPGATVVATGDDLRPAPGETVAAAGRRLATAARRWRSLLPVLDGRPAYLLSGLPDPAGAVAGVATFLGLDRPGDTEAAGQDTGRAAATTDAEAADGGLSALLDGLVGPHPCFACPPLPPEHPLAAALAVAEAEAAELAGALEWAARRIEPLLRTEAPEDGGTISSVALAGGAGGDPGLGGPYPINASEDRAGYHDWLRQRRRPVRLDGPPVLHPATAPPAAGTAPAVSVVVPVHRPPLWALERCVASVLAQDLASWQLCLCDDGSGDPALSARLAELAALDPRIALTARPEPGGISAATNAALTLATGELVAFLDHDDELSPHALRLVVEAATAEPTADVVYTDEDKLDADGERYDPFFKPEWSPDLLLSYAYLAHLTAVRRSLVAELGGLRSELDGSQDWDLALRATERARAVVHVADVCYHWRSLPTSTSSGAAAKPWAFEAGRRVLEDALARRGGGEVVQSPRFPGRYHVRRALARRPLVSAVIPFRDEPALLATCVASLRAAPGYDRFELVLVDNGSELPETAELLERLTGQPGVRVLRDPRPFNWAAINNAAAEQAEGELLLFANNDIEAHVPRWLHAMVGHALRPEVGAVGARLLYPDQTIQHAGVVIGLGGIAGHVLRGLPADQPGYASMAIQTRNCSVVTGACMMVRRDVFEQIGRFDEELPVAFNDVDFCLRLREKGYLLVYEPLAELVHHESRSRGHTDDLAEGERIVERWAPAIVAGDPYLNANLSHWRYWCPLSTAQEDYRWKTYLETSMSTPRSSSTT